MKLHQMSAYTNLSKINNQPKEGFDSKEAADDYIWSLNDSDWDYKYYDLTIMKIWISI